MAANMLPIDVTTSWIMENYQSLGLTWWDFMLFTGRSRLIQNELFGVSEHGPLLELLAHLDPWDRECMGWQLLEHGRLSVAEPHLFIAPGGGGIYSGTSHEADFNVQTVKLVLSLAGVLTYCRKEELLLAKYGPGQGPV